MARFLISRILQSILVVFIIITATFFLIRLAPGGPYAKEKKTSPEIIEQLEKQAGLDKPMAEQYLIYLKNLARGNLMVSFKYEGRRVSEIIGDSLPVSALLGTAALVIALIVGIPIGIVSAVKRNSPADYFSMSIAMIGICLPTFVLGPLLALIFGLKLNWFNASGWYDPHDWVLPSVTLGLYYAAYIARLTRGGMLEILTNDFIRTARAKGVPASLVIMRHSLRGGLLPVIAFLGPALAGLISGSFVIEKVFNIPGMGQHFIDAAFNSDYTLLMGTVIVYGSAIVILNLVVDFVLVLMNPKMTFAQA